MSTHSELSIGGVSYGGTPKRVDDVQASLFNSNDLTRQGLPGEKCMVRAYRITVDELRRRLEALGYSLAGVRESVVATLKRGYDQLENFEEDPRYRRFLDYGCQVTVDDLIEVAHTWRKNEYDVSSVGEFNLDDFQGALLRFLQGDIPALLPSEDIWLNGFAFERLLCEIFEEDDIFEIDFSALIQAGYYKADADPIGNSYDISLAQMDEQAFVLGSIYTEEESEQLEFKSVTSANPCDAISHSLKKYVIGFLNKDGGRTLYGISDAGVVEGISIDRATRDELRRKINAACLAIRPTFPLEDIAVRYRPVIGAAHTIFNRFIIEIAMPAGHPDDMYFTATGDTWVRFGTETRSLKGHELFVHICSAYLRKNG